MTMFGGCQLSLWEGSDPTLSQEGFPASRTPSPASARAARTSAICGPSSHDWCASSDPVGCLVRTCLASALPQPTKCSWIWKRQATPAGRSWWVLTTLERRTGGSGCGLSPHPDWVSGLWSTATARDWHSDRSRKTSEQLYGKKGRPLPRQVLSAAGLLDPANPSTTGKSRDCEVVGHRGSWTTPCAADVNESMGGYERPSRAATGRTTEYLHRQVRGVLNSRWVLQLMGYPSTWCDLPAEQIAKLSKRPGTASVPRLFKPSAAPSSRRKRS